MCVILYRLYKCGCKEAKSVDPCPMMDKALDLVDVGGVPENDPRIQRLEDQCGDKSAARYELQSRICELCSASITAVGMEAWLVAKEMRDLDEESKCHLEMELREAPAQSSMDLDYRGKGDLLGDNDQDYDDDGTSTASMGTAKAVTFQHGQNLMRFLRDDVVELSSSSAQAGKATVLQPGKDAIDLLNNKKDAGNPADMEAALAAVLAARVDLGDLYDDENIYDADGDDQPVGDVDDTDVRASRSGAPSPSYGLDSTDGGLGIRFKNRAKR
jgi:hypothetical protein